MIKIYSPCLGTFRESAGSKALIDLICCDNDEWRASALQVWLNYVAVVSFYNVQNFKFRQYGKLGSRFCTCLFKIL